ncbi:hypothetical protein [Gilvimarinus xylanilyticus]|uniref:Uncharacterized protein n=1 Tax=Gilvimarinus xylanilyticus TaxID=2944139 RepID=A0A9X2HY96_9GAMM|nr:hypothetical protein [Gilvimarinus xylanilyticus]MCP8900663.1 hypothetical protein [Gilvimarinus xylanilyticus]
MIYIQESSLEHQLNVLERISAKSSFVLILWNYPKASKQIVPLIGGKLFNQGFEAVTEYFDNTVLMHSRPLAARPSLLSYLSRFKRELERSVDSICLYSERSKHWSACSIGHEGMCLVRDESFLEPLLAAGFNASIEAPDWW